MLLHLAFLYLRSIIIENNVSSECNLPTFDWSKCIFCQKHLKGVKTTCPAKSKRPDVDKEVVLCESILTNNNNNNNNNNNKRILLNVT